MSGSLVRFTTPTQAPIRIDPAKVATVKKKLTAVFAELDMTRGDIDGMPTVIETQSDCNALSDTIVGPLFFDAPYGEETISLRQRTIVVLGDLQLTGDMKITGGTLMVLGEVRLNDKSALSDVEVQAKGRVFFADESSFSGKLVTESIIEIYNEALILKGSLLIAFGEKKKSTTRKRQLFDISVRENALVEGSLISLGAKGGGIQTEDEVQTMGLLLSTLPIYHRGEHEGYLQAPALQNPNDTVGTTEKRGISSSPKKTTAENLLWGRITYSFDTLALALPWFIGEPSRQSWREE